MIVTRRRANAAFALLLPMAAMSCGDLPRPFMGRPGVLGAQLSRPPPPRLAVPPPTTALLTSDAGEVFATAVAGALADQSVPAVASQVKAGDWRLILTAETHGTDVIPTYTVENPAGASQGSADGAPIPASAWAAGDTATLHQAATAAAPAIAALLTRIEAAIQQSDPTSLVNRPARINFTGVTGAPGDGNQSLARQMRGDLASLGLVIQDSAVNADFSLRCEIKTGKGTGDTVRVEIQWVVDAPGPPPPAGNGGERGRVVQINEVPPGTLDHYWGDVAVVVAQEAAGGVRQVILNQTAAHQLAGDKPVVKP